MVDGTRKELERFAQRVADLVVGKLAGKPAEEILDAYEAAELLKVSRSTIDRWTATGRIPSLKYGNLRRYKRSELLRLTSDQPNPNVT
jgi:excisionase family DNA binding protein